MKTKVGFMFKGLRKPPSPVMEIFLVDGSEGGKVYRKEESGGGVAEERVAGWCRQGLSGLDLLFIDSKLQL